MPFFLCFLLCVDFGCSPKSSSPQQNNVTTQTPPQLSPAILRKDVKAPKIISIVPSAYIDEFNQKEVSFKDGDPVLYRKWVTKWNLEPAISQTALEKDKKHLPYFIVTVRDEDTVARDLSLFYSFSIESSDTEYNIAERYRLNNQEDQWVIILSRQTASDDIYTQAGKHKIILHLKAKDMAGNETVKDDFFFEIENLKPKISIHFNQPLNEIEEYLKEKKLGSFSMKSDNVEKIRQGKKLSEKKVIANIVIENETDDDLYVKLDFIQQKILFRQEKWFQNLSFVSPYVSELISRKSFLDALLESEIIEEANFTNLKTLGHVLLLPGKDIHNSSDRHKAHFVLLSNFNFEKKTPEEILNPSIKPNTLIESLVLNGYLEVATVPVRVPQNYYRFTTNWDVKGESYTYTLKRASSLF